MLGKKQMVVAAVVLALTAAPAVLFAGDYHFGSTLVCSDCHIMHYSQQHGYNPDGSGFWVTEMNGPNAYLLRNDVNELCLSCHNNSAFAPDVFEGHSNGYVRQAGGLNDLTSAGPYHPETGHTLNTTDVAPGGTFNNADGMTCVDCHSPHGSGFGNSYRNLAGFGTAPGPGAWISYTREDVVGESPNPLTAWVHEDASSGTSGNHYGVGAITFNEPDNTTSGYANFCKGCHTDFHGLVGGVEVEGSGAPPEHFVRHPNGGVDIGAIGGGHSSLGVLSSRVNQVQVMSPTGQKAGGYDGTDTGVTPSCFSCHKGHGNQNAFGLIFMAGTGTIDEEGDDGTQARDNCKQCHVQGG